MKKSLLLAFTLILIAGATAQSLDGVITVGEYAFSETKNGISVYASLSADRSTIRVAVVAKTGGWVAIGLGSPKMDKSFMILGFMKDGVASFTEETGKGWSHSVNSTRIATVTVREEGGSTILEASIPAGTFIKAGELDIIAAYGAKDDRTSKHVAKAAYKARL